jgi:hypothetical protein
MYRAVFAFSLLMAASPACATDWRFVYTGEEEESATFVDLDSINPRDGTIRQVTTYTVLRETDSDGDAASMIEQKVDCDGRRLSITRIISYDRRERETGDYSGTRPWIGDFPADTQGAMMVDYVCSNGASDPAVESWGAERPFKEMRRQLRARKKRAR